MVGTGPLATGSNGARQHALTEEQLRTLMTQAIMVVAKGLDSMSNQCQLVVNQAVCRGGRVDLRVSLSIEAPVVSMVLCDLEGTQRELGYSQLDDVAVRWCPTTLKLDHRPS